MSQAVSDFDLVHGTLIVDARGVIRYCSAPLAHIVRRRSDELLGAAVRSVLPDYPLDVIVGHEETPSQAAGAPEVRPINLHLATAEGRSIPVNVLASTLPCEPSSLVVLDVWTSSGKLEHAATHDSLTGLPNRQLFFDRLGQALRQAARRASGLAVAVVDVDRFKEVNDALGHLTGDAVLKAVASRLARSVREADIVARLGGDQFGLVLLDIAEPGTLAPVLAKIERVFERPVLVGEHSIPVSMSIGACLYPAAGLSEHDLMHCADEQMRQAKRGGGARYCIERARAATDE